MKTLSFLTALALVIVASAWGADDPCNGPDFEKDLKEKMPPVEDQGFSPWCATFTVKALLDYNVHFDCEENSGSGSKKCAYKEPENRLSAEDINALRTDAPPEFRGKSFDLTNGDAVVYLLEGVQKDGALTEAQLPFDQALFASSATDISLLSKLSGYYSGERDRLAAVATGNCRAPKLFEEVEKMFPGVQEIADRVLASNPDRAAGKTRFLDEVSQKYLAIPESLRAQRKQLSPAFNFEEYSTSDENEFKSHLVDTLKSGQPLAAEVCMYQLEDLAKIPDNSPRADACGAHGMTVIGFQKTADGNCQVHLRNSWGDRWPDVGKKHGDGNVWVNAADFMKALGRTPDGMSTLFSVSRRSATDPIANHIHQGRTEFVGDTSGGIWSKGRLTMADGTVMDGKFRDGQLTQGKVTNADGTYLEGSFTAEGKLDRGTATNDRGDVFQGKFVNGVIMCGTMLRAGKLYCMLNNRGMPATGGASSCKCPAE